MDNNWNPKEPSVRIQQIVRIGDTFAVTLSEEMIDHLKFTEKEGVQVEIREHELVIRKNIPFESMDGISAEFSQTLHETIEQYGATLKELKDR